MLDHAAIARRIPHAGSMCLLQEIPAWNKAMIQARATSHREIDHPLRSAGGLGITAGIEYAAQAMAVHGSLLSDGLPRAGRLASARAVRCHVRWLDREPAALDITARRISGDDAGMVYDFEIRAAGKLLMNGRASVALVPAGTP